MARLFSTDSDCVEAFFCDIISLVCHYQADNLCGRVGEEDALPGVLFSCPKDSTRLARLPSLNAIVASNYAFVKGFLEIFRKNSIIILSNIEIVSAIGLV